MRHDRHHSRAWSVVASKDSGQAKPQSLAALCTNAAVSGRSTTIQPAIATMNQASNSAPTGFCRANMFHSKNTTALCGHFASQLFRTSNDMNNQFRSCRREATAGLLGDKIVYLRRKRAGPSRVD